MAEVVLIRYPFHAELFLVTSWKAEATERFLARGTTAPPENVSTWSIPNVPACGYRISRVFPSNDPPVTVDTATEHLC